MGNRGPAKFSAGQPLLDFLSLNPIESTQPELGLSQRVVPVMIRKRTADQSHRLGLLFLLAGLVGICHGFPPTAQAQEDRYVGELADGSRAAGKKIDNWHDEKQSPSLAGKAIFDEKNPFRWLIDHSLSPASEPGAFVEFFGGDRLPGSVVGFRSGAESRYLALPEHLIVNPSIPLDSPRAELPSQVRVTTEWIKRVVWEPRTLDLYKPGHVFLKDGREIAFRSLRWADKSFTLLLDDGIQEIFFNDVKEVHLPRPDVWEIYYQQMAVLSPGSAVSAEMRARILQLETSDGLKATISTERLKPFVHGNRNQTSGWYHQCQPAWSLDPFWVRFDSVWCRRFFWPDEVPLTCITPASARQDSPLGSSWYWRQDRNVFRQPLQSGGKNFGWGFGVHAFHELVFPLSAAAKGFRTRAGLDQSAGAGGSVRWQVSLRGAEEKTLHQSPVVRGTDQVLDSGRLTFPEPKDPKSSRSLVLSVDPLLTGAPEGADPLDVRDSFNWLEPVLLLDREQLRQELARQSLSQIAALADWTLETPAGSACLGCFWDEYDREDPRYRVLLGSQGPFVSFTNTLAIGPQDRWLVLAVNRPSENSPEVSLQVHLDGAAVAELDIPAARDARGPDPLLIPVDSFRGRSVDVRLVQIPGAFEESQEEQKTFAVDWRGISTSEHHPGLLPLLTESEEFLEQLSEGEGTIALETGEAHSGETSVKVTGGGRGSSRLPELDIPIRAMPRLGEYRYISFAWKKTDGREILFAVAHDGVLGGEELGNRRPRIRRDPAARGGEVRARRSLESYGRGLEFGYRYLRGPGQRELAPALRLDPKLPTDWQRVDRDLFRDFGEFTLTGFSLICPNGTAAWFDEIYLARDLRDLEHLPSRRSETSPPEDPNILVLEANPESFGLVRPGLTGPFAISGAGDSVQLVKEHQGKNKVLRTRPANQKTPCVLRAPLLLPAEQKSRLELEVHHHPEGDWKLVVLANGETLREQAINEEAAGKNWAKVSVDLSKFQGQPVLVEIQNAPTGWNHEEAYWSRIAVVSE